MGRWKVVDNNFDLHIEDTYAIEDKHETNIYDIYELCRRLNNLEAICSHQKEVIQLWKDECKQLEDKNEKLIAENKELKEGKL